MRGHWFGLLAFVVAAACSPSAGSGVGGGSTTNDGGGAGLDGGDAASASDSAVTDSAVDAGEDAAVDAGPFSPAQLAGLQLWLDGAVGIAIDPMYPGQVKAWLDQSGQGHDATAEGTPGDGPKVVSSAIAGKTAVLCDKQAFFRAADAPGLQFGTGDWGMIVVAKIGKVQTSSPLTILGKSQALRVTVNQADVFGIQANGGGAAIANLPINSFQIMSARGAKLEVRANGNVGTGPTTTADLSEPGPPLDLCGGGSSGLSMTLAEMIVVKGTLDDASLAKTVSYLKTKFGL